MALHRPLFRRMSPPGGGKRNYTPGNLSPPQMDPKLRRYKKSRRICRYLKASSQQTLEEDEKAAVALSVKDPKQLCAAVRTLMVPGVTLQPKAGDFQCKHSGKRRAAHIHNSFRISRLYSVRI